MIIALSRFRLAKPMEKEVRQAFLDRPRLVDDEPGFLGLEVFQDSKDTSRFFLVTRWTDIHSFEKWHGSESHRKSHKGIPRGLKLDPKETQVLYLERIEEPDAGVSPHQVLDLAWLLHSFLQRTETICLINVNLQGVIQSSNSTLLRALEKERHEIIGTPIDDHLAEPDRKIIRELLNASDTHSRIPFSLNFVDRQNRPFTLRCWTRLNPDGLTILGEASPGSLRSRKTEAQSILTMNPHDLIGK